MNYKLVCALIVGMILAAYAVVSLAIVAEQFQHSTGQVKP